MSMCKIGYLNRKLHANVMKDHVLRPHPKDGAPKGEMVGTKQRQKSKGRVGNRFPAD